MQVHAPSSNLKCPTCILQFSLQLQHKQHYKSDFHRYNLKRSMVNLPAATLQQFKSKRTQVKNQSNSNTYQCGQCRKVFSNMKTLKQHGYTKSHQIDKIIQNTIIKKQKPKISYKLNQSLCIFCSYQSNTIQQSLLHMSKLHGFFISQEQYCVNKVGLIHYLQQKIQTGMLCIYCDNKGAHDFVTGQSVRAHMLSKNHTFMNTSNGFQEYQKYYDFSELFKIKLQQQKYYQPPVGINFEKVKVIVDEKVKQMNKKQIKQKKQKKANNNNINNDNKMLNESQQQQQQQQWQEQQTSQQQQQQQWQDESQQQQQTKMIQQQNQQQQIIQKQRQKIKSYQIMVPTITNTDQLLLPNGKTLGHRKYRAFYKQSFKINNWFENNNMKMLEEGGTQNAVILRQRLMELIRGDNLMKNNKKLNNKRQLKVGMNNNMLMKFFRTSCSLG